MVSPPAIWGQLPPDRRRRLQQLLADLLTRPVLAEALAQEVRHDDHRS
ncbi:hypothetical protein [Fimbriiglobus ruber]|nr:hypothetical protein [Fimbriiglobus ruber]